MDEQDEFVAASLLFILSMGVACLNLLNNRRWWVRRTNAERKTRGAFNNLFDTIKNNDSEMFKRYTRMTPTQFDKLLFLIKPRLLKRSRRMPLSPGFRLALTVKYLAHGGSFQNIAWEFRVGASTAGKIIAETSKAIWEVLHPIYLSEPTTDEWQEISRGFDLKWNFPHTLGALDGKHIQIQCPFNSGSMFFNYKRHFSLVLLATCDANYCFTWVDVGSYGSESDGGIFRKSSLKRRLDVNDLPIPAPELLPGIDIEVPYFFIGDAAFPMTNYLMRPYPGRFLTEIKRIFNYRLSRARRTIENAFGILSSRWRVFRAPIACSVPTTQNIVQATLCLHNFLMKDKEPGCYNKINWKRIVCKDTNLTPIGRCGANVAARLVYELRDKIANYLMAPEGEVPWQYTYVHRGC